MKNGLKNSVKDYLDSQELNSEQLECLTNLLNSSQEKQAKRQEYKIRAMAAVLLVALTAGIYLGVIKNNKSNIPQLIAEEVAHNHLKMKPLEVAGGSLNDVRVYFDKLDFSLTSSSFVANNNLQLLGGRYCSIQGETAAQLQMKDEKTGSTHIVYQAPYDKDMFAELPHLQEGQQPVRTFVNGIAVDVWVEKGVLFARSFSQ